MSFENGRLVAIDGGSEATRLSNLLESLEDKNAYEFAAWGIGTNPGAALVGEDPSFEGERVHGWTHVSTGSSAALPGGTVQAKIHLDGIISQPTIYLDDELILKNGVTLFTRAERVQNDELLEHNEVVAAPVGPLPPRPVFTVGKITAGGIYDLVRTDHMKFGLGVLASRYSIPETLKADYGDPTSYMVFARLKIQ